MVTLFKKMQRQTEDKKKKEKFIKVSKKLKNKTANSLKIHDQAKKAQKNNKKKETLIDLNIKNSKENINL